VIEKLEQNPACANDFIVEFGSFNWSFKPKALLKFFPDPQRITEPFNP